MTASSGSSTPSRAIASGKGPWEQPSTPFADAPLLPGLSDRILRFFGCLAAMAMAL